MPTLEKFVSGRLQVYKQTPRHVDKTVVLDCIAKNNGEFIDGNLRRMVDLYPDWCLAMLTQHELAKLDWYFNPDDSGHISQTLTSRGKNRQLGYVAQQYIQLQKNNELEWAEATKIESIISWLEQGKNISPIVIVPGERYPDSPDSSFIDGVHRSLAVFVYYLRSQDNVRLPAFVGKKAPILKRAVNIFKRMRT